jgi:nucleosome assembly protein 1-like 1
MRNHPVLGGLITEEDLPALLSLSDIKLSYNEDMSGFTLTFTFDENEFFSNTVNYCH